MSSLTYSSCELDAMLDREVRYLLVAPLQHYKTKMQASVTPECVLLQQPGVENIYRILPPEEPVRPNGPVWRSGSSPVTDTLPESTLPAGKCLAP